MTKPLDAKDMEKFLLHLASCARHRSMVLGRSLTAPELLWCYTQFLIDMGYEPDDRRAVFKFAKRVVVTALSERRVDVQKITRRRRHPVFSNA